MRLLLLFSVLFAEQTFVTYDFSGGRFGDNLLAYLHARWYAYEQRLPFLYKPFPYSDQLALHDLDVQILPEGASLHTCPYFPESRWERAHVAPAAGKWNSFAVKWKDPEFRRLALEAIRPKEPLNLVYPPEGAISIALHYRDPAAEAVRGVARNFPTKFPPLKFYEQGLSAILDRLPNKPVYCFVFTDAENPSMILRQLKRNAPRVHFACRSGRASLLDDFFSFFNFDILIHSESNFSMIPALLHDYAMTYAPMSGHCKGSTIIIDKTKLEINRPIH